VTAYALRHSNITQLLRRGASPKIITKLHDTSAAEIAEHYAAFIVLVMKISPARC
jgi:site-specific recombinase XerD